MATQPESDKMKTAIAAITAILATAAIFIGIYYFYILPNQPDVDFLDEEINPNINVLEILGTNDGGERIITPTTGQAENLLGYIGMILMIDENEPGAFQWIGDFRPPRDEIEIVPLDEKLYEGIITSNVSVGGEFTAFTGSFGSEDVAELSIQNSLALQHRDNTLIPWQELRGVPRDSGKMYWYVDSAILTIVNYRKFQKVEARSSVSGVAFGANGNIYASVEGFSSDRKLKLRLMALNPLRPFEGTAINPPQDIIDILRKPLIENLIEANTLVEYLREQSEQLPLDLQNIQDNLDLDNGLGQIPDSNNIDWDVKLNNVPIFYQTKKNDCWAVVTSMLLAAKTGISGETEDIINILGEEWLDLYLSDTGLLDNQKERFLNESGFSFDYGMSYFPRGIANLLSDFGPIWFTVGLDSAFNKHASIVTGISNEMPNGAIYISYIDPFYGQEYIETYVSFMQRYEYPAELMNDILWGEISSDDYIPVHVSYLN